MYLPDVCPAPDDARFSRVPVVRAFIDIDWPVPTVDASAVTLRNVAAPVVEDEVMFTRLPV